MTAELMGHEIYQTTVTYIGTISQIWGHNSDKKALGSIKCWYSKSVIEIGGQKFLCDIRPWSKLHGKSVCVRDFGILHTYIYNTNKNGKRNSSKLGRVYHITSSNQLFRFFFYCIGVGTINATIYKFITAKAIFGRTSPSICGFVS